MTGRMLDERLGKLSFWVVFIGFNLAFLPMHLTGLRGMPRRIYTYPRGMGWDDLNMLTTVGAFLLAIGVLLVLINIVTSLRRGARWRARTRGTGDVGMVDPFATAAVQFQGDPARHQPASAVGAPIAGNRGAFVAPCGDGAGPRPRDRRHIAARRRTR